MPLSTLIKKLLLPFSKPKDPHTRKGSLSPLSIWAIEEVGELFGTPNGSFTHWKSEVLRYQIPLECLHVEDHTSEDRVFNISLTHIPTGSRVVGNSSPDNRENVIDTMKFHLTYSLQGYLQDEERNRQLIAQYTDKAS